jgi:tetratricopeptide (TPR) repeat protein
MLKELTRDFKLPKSRGSEAVTVSDSRLQSRNFAGFCCLWLVSGTILLLFLFVPAASGGAALSENEKKDLYSQGTEYFHQATGLSDSDQAAARELYAKALLRFERLVEEGGVENGKLFYNIGNIHFLLDDLGRAILNYRRAGQYIPNDPNLAKNLAYARSMRQDKLESKDKEKILQTLFFFHYDLGSQTRLSLFTIFYIAFWIFAGIKIFTKRPFTSWGLGVALLFTLLFGSSLFMESRQSTMGHIGVILDPEVIGRQGDAESYQPSFEVPLHAGAEFTLLEERGAWWQIELPDGRSSWIPRRSGELVGKNQAQRFTGTKAQSF